VQAKQMLEADVRPIVFSYHQDIDERLQQLVSKVRFLDFHGLDFNPLQVIDRGSRTGHLDVAGALRDIFAAIYPEIGDIQGERIRRAIKESFIEQGWEDPNAEIANLMEPPFRRFLDILRADPKPDRGLKTLLGRLEELDDYGFFKPGENSETLWGSEQPTVIRIHTTQNDNLQKAFASLIFYGLYKDMFRRGIQQRITHAVVFDEAHRAARLRLVPTMAKECRKYGISLVLASQEAKDFNISLFSAIANYLVLRLNETDAKALVRNVSSSDQERTLVDRIKQLDRFKALYFCEGKKRPAYLTLPP
jgi:DNA phosphorothioation-dependent restriction protein DptH